MKRYKFLLPVLMLALVVSTVAGMLGTVAASPASAPAAAVVNIPDTGNANAGASQAAKPDPNKVVDGVACRDVSKLGIDKQMNVHASLIMMGCGLTPEASSNQLPSTGGNMALPPNYGGTDIDIILPDGTPPHITQSESFVWGHGSTIVVNYNDSRNAASTCYSGVSYSTDGGATFHAGTPLCSGHGNNYGDPTVVWDNAHSVWVATDLASGCGGQGVGAWRSIDGITWTAGGCALTSSQGDRNSSWVDNTPSSPHYGTVYSSYNDFNVGGGALYVSRSTDGGVTWLAGVQLNPSFIRDVQLTGAADGTVLEAAMNENGGTNNPRNNVFYRSADGGATFTQVYNGPAFYPAGRSSSGYFEGMYTSPAGYFRYMSWGQPAGGGPQIAGQNVFHYVYSMGISGVDPGNIEYIRSTDNGVTWSAPLQLNTDTTNKAQFMPSLSETSSGALMASWYDERNNGYSGGNCSPPGANVPCYEWFGRVSLDNGATWQADMAVSDAISPLPAQNDPNIQPLYVGDYNYASTDGNTAYTTWTDGRTLIGGTSQQDVYFDKVNVTVGTPTPTVTGTPPTNTPTRTPTVTPTRTNTSTPLPCGSIRILIAYADLGGPPTTLQTALLAEPGVSAVDLFDAASGTPPLALLQQYNEVMSFTNNTYSDPTGMGNVIADYQDGGGIVVVATFAFYNGFNISGRWVTGGYSPFNLSSTANFSSASLGSYIAGHPLMNGVTTLTAFYRVAVTTAAGATQVATYTDGLPLASVKTTSGHTAVGINAYLGQNPANFSGQWAKLIANAARWLINCGTPTQTVTPGGPTNTPPPPTPTATPTQCGGPTTWQTVAPGPLDVYGAAGAADANNAYFAGGYSFSLANQTNQLVRYNVGSNTWSTLAPMTPNGAVEMASANYSPSNNKVYVMGGGTVAGTVYADNRIYDVAGNTWTSGAPMPGIRGFAASGYFNGNIYIVGGYTTGNISPAYTQTWQYNIAADTWTTKTGVPAPLGFGGAASAVINGHLYVAGGRDSSNTTIGTLWDYDIAADSWTARANLPATDNVPGAAVLNGKLYVYGGGNPFNGSDSRAFNPSRVDTTNATYIYDPTANSWTSGPNLNQQRSFPGYATVGNTAVTYGGYTGSNTTTSTEVLHVGTACATGTPTPVPPTATSTPVPPTASMTATSTPVPPTATSTQVPATATSTQVPATATSTQVPATATSTQVPATATSTQVPATNTPIASVTPTDCPNPFVDINGNTFYYAIHYLYCRGVVNGLDPTHYGPAGTATRGQFAKVVVLGFGETLFTPTGGTQDFTDVPPSYFAYVYIETGFHYGILSGFDHAGCTAHGATFPCYLPNIPITRGQLTKLVVNAGGYTLITPTGGGQDFTDVPPSNVFYVSIETAYHNSIINGYPDHTFRPNANIRRDEMAQIVYEGIIHRP